MTTGDRPILVLHEHGVIRGAVATVLEMAYPGILIVQCSGVSEAIGVLEGLVPLVVVVDLTILGETETETVVQAVIGRRDTRLIAIATERNLIQLREVIRSGIAVPLLRGATVRDLTNLVMLSYPGSEEGSHAGDPVASSGPTLGSSRSRGLTQREQSVLSLVADGLANKEIAAELDIAEHTVKSHVRTIMSKLGASSRTQAATLGIKSGLYRR